MPRVRRTRRVTKRRYRPYPKRTLKRRSVAADALVMPNVSVRRSDFGFPETLVTTLRYADVYTLTSTAQAVAKQVFRMNSCFDPDFTGTGHQPYYFDQLAAVYGGYCVIGSKLTATFSPITDAIATAQPSGPMVIGIVGEPNGTTSSTAYTLLETSGAVSTLLGGPNGGNNVKTLFTTYSPNKNLALGDEDDTVQATVSANPSQVWYATVFMAETGLGTPTSCNVKVELQMTVRFRRREDIASS